MSEDKSLQEFLSAFDDRKKKESHRAQHERRKIEQKRELLKPIRNFLQHFVTMGLVIQDARAGDPGISPDAQQKFAFYEAESSPTWGPGISLYFDHPAEVEIAIPNDSQIPEYGPVVIRSVTNHKDRNMLHQKFHSVDAAKDAVARFLGKNALAIENDPRKRVSVSKTPDASVLENSPKGPPPNAYGASSGAGASQKETPASDGATGSAGASEAA